MAILLLFGEPITVDPATVGQFTGGKAAEEKEVYEGDILDFTVFDFFGYDTQYCGFVKWIGTSFILQPIGNEDESFDLDWVLAQDDEVTIIGNVHDNPELIRGGND